MPFNCEIVNYSKTKEKYWVRIQGQALYDKEGAIIKYFAIEEDITAQKNLEDQKENLISDLANKKFESLKDITSEKSDELGAYINMLPSNSKIKAEFRKLTSTDFDFSVSSQSSNSEGVMFTLS